ncbi:hypothetical protein NITHO_3010007 [Nitrolancea hollandica Lb]|uniref:Uncharacterized protein n=1 Tax=Nitrolancea hollandica Lb TaxID=1129897 RepID=I4EH64_9BACT|nr:hypothetical protein NITHO_3010007 [Nitrolancea hollandica Lb]
MDPGVALRTRRQVGGAGDSTVIWELGIGSFLVPYLKRWDARASGIQRGWYRGVDCSAPSL